MSKLIRVVGFDPSLRNWGKASGHLALPSQEIILDSLDITQPDKLEGKQVRNNSNDLHLAEQLASNAFQYLSGANVVFVEVPIGSQSARAMASYGICIGVLAALRAQGVPLIEVTPNEVKLAGPGNKNATKREMIQWAYDTHPHLPWPFITRAGVKRIVESKAEHMADAVATIHAGVATKQFQQLLSLSFPQ
jgi:Holliday junction resolvasome RuvABC endonuclease subunit